MCFVCSNKMECVVINIFNKTIWYWNLFSWFKDKNIVETDMKAPALSKRAS